MYDFIPCAGAIVFFFLLFGFIIALRYLGYRETLALAEKGLVKPERRNGDGKGALRWGIVLTALGMALCIGLFPIGFWVNIGNRSFPFGPWLLPGLLPMFFGLGLVLIYVLTREPKPKDEVAAKEVKPPTDTATAKIEPPPAQ